MTDELVYENVPVGVRQRGDSYEVGLVIDGAFLAFGSYKGAGFEQDVEEGRAAAAEAKKSKRSSSKSDTAEA